MKTILAKQKDIAPAWYVVDASGKTLGRLATQIVTIIRGKNKPLYTPNLNMGDKVIVVNADKIRVTGNKEKGKIYYRHTGYPGGLKQEPYFKIVKRKPCFPLEHAIKGMLPHGPLGRRCFQNVKIYAGAQHPHQAQNPQVLDL
ncbi:MAG TPA: 50S ribosomal protein L13 [Spirochaetia bacterium]|nr:50S ribosomal protein L13 [Spirochaetia bacterium]